MNSESSATATKLGPKNTMKKTGTVQYSCPADVDEPVSDDDGFSVVGTDPVRTAIPASSPNFMPSPGKQSYPHANFNSGAFRYSQQTRRETNIKEVSGLATYTVNSNGKYARTAISRAEPNCLADAVEPPRNIVLAVPTIDTTILVEQGGSHLKASQSQLSTERSSPPDSSPLFASNLSQYLAAIASEQILVEASAQHLVMLASEAWQHAGMWEETQVSTPTGHYYTHDQHSGVVDGDILVPEAVQGSHPPAPFPANKSSSGYSTPGKLWLQLPSFPSSMLAAGFPSVSAETHVWSPLRSVSVIP